jgi:hypothetical protein
MAKVSIAKLLKTKNRIAGEITRVKSKIKQHNAYLVEKNAVETPVQVNVPELSDELVVLTNRLVAVKSAINAANVKAAPKIYRLSEVKGQIAFWESVDCEAGKSNRYSFDQNENEVKKVQVSISERDQRVKELIKESEVLQDELDEFNATHRIEIEDDVIL